MHSFEYPRNTHGLLEVGKSDINDIANTTLSDLQPDVLDIPMALDIRNLAEEKIRVNIIEAEVNSCNNLYGCIAFNSFYFPFDESNGINLECGNIIINTKLNKNKNDWRFTLAHEISHWILHRVFYSNNQRSLALRQHGRTYISSKDDSRELSKKNPILCKTEYDWIEWQADTLATALLMPGTTFIKESKRILTEHGYKQMELISGVNVDEGKKVVKELAGIYGVSERLVRCRMRDFELYKGNA